MAQNGSKVKGQGVRLIDVFLLGPAMVVVGLREGTWLGSAVAIAGVGTVLYNGVNYMTVRRRSSR